MKGTKWIAGAMVVSLLAGGFVLPAEAALPGTTWSAPTKPMGVDDNIIKCGAKACYGTYAQFFGANQVSARETDYPGIYNAANAKEAYTTALNVSSINKSPQILHCIGTSANLNPDPYEWNLLYNIAVDAGAVTGSRTADQIILTATRGGEDADTSDEYGGTTATLSRRPDLLIHSTGSNDETWVAALPENKDSDKTNDYQPTYVTMSPYLTLQNWIDDMYNVADALDMIQASTGKTTRYYGYGDTPQVIASRYEAYIKGLQYYVNKKISDGTVKKKTVAIIDSTGTDTDGNGTLDTYTLLDSKTSFDSAASCRTALYVAETTTNIIDKLNIKKDASGAYTVSAEDMCANADVIMAINGAHVSTTETEVTNNLTAAGIMAEDVPEIIAQDPAGIFVYTAQSPENGMGVGLYLGRVYPEIINPVYASMYWYEHFWHVQPFELVSLAGLTFQNASLPKSIAANGKGYDEAAIEAMIKEGLAYGRESAQVSKYKGTSLELSDRLTNYESQHTDHDLQETPIGSNKYYECTVCHKRFLDERAETEITDSATSFVNGDNVTTITALDILENGSKATKRYTGKGKENEATAVFLNVKDYLEKKGLDYSTGCHYELVGDNGTFVSDVKEDAFKDVCLYIQESGSIRSAMDGSAGRMWINAIEEVRTTGEHDYSYVTAGVEKGHTGVCSYNDAHRTTADHLWGEPVTTPATYDKEGEVKTTCEICGQSKTEIIPRLTEPISGSRIAGDANDDGTVNGLDLICMKQYFAGYDVSMNQSNADVTGDGKVNGLDVIRMCQYFAGGDVALQ